MDLDKVRLRNFFQNLTGFLFFNKSSIWQLFISVQDFLVPTLQTSIIVFFNEQNNIYYDYFNVWRGYALREDYWVVFHCWHRFRNFRTIRTDYVKSWPTRFLLKYSKTTFLQIPKMESPFSQITLWILTYF